MSAPAFAPAQSASGRAPAWCYAVIIAATLVAYHNSLQGPFVFDDASSIVTNPSIRRLAAIGDVLAGPGTNVTAQGRPLLNLSLAINHAIGGTAVEGYHVGNLLLHACAGLVLFGILRRMWPRDDATRSRRGHGVLLWPLVAAVIWTVHPLQTESVTYIIQRAESLLGLFYLLTIYCFARATVGPANVAPAASPHASTSRGWLALSVLSCTAGMATKEVMATAPLMVLIFDRTLVSGSFASAWRQRRGYYLALAGTWLLLAWLVVQTGGNRGGSAGFGVGVRWWDYWLTQFPAVARYLWLSVWPHPLVFEYGSFWIWDFSEITIPFVVVVGLLIGTVVALRKRSAAGFLGAWFFGMLAPTSLAPGTPQMIVEHRMYLPLAAVVVAFVASLDRLRPAFSFRRAVIVSMAVILALTVLTVRRNADYRSELALWTDTASKRPKNPLAHYMLAQAQERVGDRDGALASYERSLELKPDFSIGHEHFGELLLRAGRRAEAIVHFESALRLQPGYADAHANLGNAYLAENRITEAVGHLERAVELAPESAMNRYNLGNALAAAGLDGEAIEQFQAALQRQPGMAEAHLNLANALVATRRPVEAMPHYEAAVKARPGFAAAHYNYANALAAAGRQSEAVEQYIAALRARPDHPEAHHNLGSALFELGRYAEAAGHYADTLRLRPDFPGARENLERVQAQLKSSPGQR